MGNQGMTNWKLTALYAVAIMLITGLFGTATIAAPGDGIIVVHNDIDAVGPGNDTDDDTGFVPVGADNYQVTFTLTLRGEAEATGTLGDDDYEPARPNAEWEGMEDGVIRIQLPDDWNITSPDSLIPSAQYTASHDSTDGTVDEGDVVRLTSEFSRNNRQVWVFLPSSFDTVDVRETTNDSDGLAEDLAIAISFRVDAPATRGGSAAATDNDDFVFVTSTRAERGSFVALGASPELRVGPRDTLVLTEVGPEGVFDNDGVADLIYAGSESVRLTFTYDPVNNDEDNMHGSILEIEIQDGWSHVDDPSTSNDDATVDGAGTIDVDGSTVTVTQAAAAVDSVTISFNVSAPNRRGEFIFVSSSRSVLGSTLTELDKQGTVTVDGDDVMQPASPIISVGNVMAGEGIVNITANDEDRAYQGDQDVRFIVTLTPAGPMYTIKDEVDDDDNITRRGQKAKIAIVFPFEIRDATETDLPEGIVEADVENLVSGGNANDHIFIYDIDAIDADDRPLVVFDGVHNVPSEIPAVAVLRNNIRIFTTTNASSAVTSPAVDEDYMRFTDIATPPTPDNPNRVIGGYIYPKAGSGSLAISPSVVEKDTEDQSLTLTYTAATDLTSIVIDGTQIIWMQLPYGVTVESEDPAIHTDSLLASGTIIWKQQAALTGADDVFTVTVNMDIPNDTDPLEIDVWVGDEGVETATDRTRDARTYVDADEDTTGGQPHLVAVVGKGEDVVFDIISDRNNLIPFPSYPAASSQIIKFRFTALNTTIEEGGEVSIVLPRHWTRPSVRDSSGRATVSVFNAPDGALPEDEPLGVSDRTITLEIAGLDKGESVTIQYGADPDGDDDYRAVMQEEEGDGVLVTGRFIAHPDYGPATGDGYTVKTIDVTIGNVADGHGTAAIRPNSVEAASTDNKMTVTFEAPGSMGGGAVSLEIPNGWGEMQSDLSTDPNYITITSRVEGVTGNYDDLNDGDGDSIVIANLPDGFEAGDEVVFTYGGDPGTAEANAVAQENVADYASFIIESDGDGDGDFAPLTSETAAPTDTDGLGQIYMEAAGELRVQVVSATEGVGTASVEIGTSKDRSQQYRLDDDSLGSIHRVHAGDDETHLTFTYNPEQDITDGQLELTIPSTWSQPQDDTTGRHGYIRFRGGDVGSPEFDHASNESTVTVAINELDADDVIEIDYGRGGDGAVAPDTVGPSSFGMRVSGGEDEPFIRIKSQLTIDVYSQRSGEGTAEVSVSDNEGELHAGDEDREVEITYTSIGQIRDGQVKLTVPENWSPVTTEDEGDNVQIAPSGAHDGDPDFPAGTTREIVAEGVNLRAGGTLTFIYTTTVQPTAGDDIVFMVEVNGGEGPGEETEVIGVHPVIDVRAARIGTGDVAVAPGVVEAGADVAKIDFTYTAVGDIFFPTEFTIIVPQGWTSATAGIRTADEGRYTVTSDGDVEKLGPLNGNMRARVARNGRVESGDTIVFSYFNATAPATPDTYEFGLLFDGEAVGTAPFEVLVEPFGGATKIAILDVDDLSIDEAVQASVMVTVQLRADDGNEAALDAELVVTLTSDSSTGMFSDAEDGTYEDEIELTIAANVSSGMAYYKDSTLGTHMLTATPDATSALDAAPGSVDVRTDNPEITSVDFEIADSAGTAKTGTLATTGDVVTVTVMATPIEEPTFAIGTALTVRDLEESTVVPGTYTGSWPVVEDLNDGTHPVTATLGGPPVAAEDQLTIDTKAPVVSVTAPAAGMVVANGETVTITVTVTDITDVSVEADVSGLDSTQADMVALTAGTDGSHSVDVPISTANEELDGMKPITVTATDAAGNEADATVMVTLDNTDPVITDPKIDMSVVMTDGEATISATLSEASTVTANVTALNAAAPTLTLMDADGDGMYSNSVMVTAADPAADGEVTITITASDTAGNAAAPVTVMVTLDNTAPVITAPSRGDDTHVMAGDTVEISAMVAGATSVSADVSGLNAAAPTLTLMDADGDGMYSNSVMVTAADPAADGEVTITITASDATGNAAAPVTVMVTLDNTAPVITAPSRGDDTHVMAGDTVMISAMVAGATSVSADVSGLNAALSPLSLTDADGDGMYSNSVMVTAADPAADGEVTITITASDATGNAAAPATVTVTLDNTAPVITAPSRGDDTHVMAGDTVMISAMVASATSVSADVSGLNAALSPLTLTDADGDGMYSNSVMVTAADPAADGEVTITITASDATGNEALATVMVTLDNTVPEVTAVSSDPMDAKNGDTVMISAMVAGATSVSADVSGLNAALSPLTLTDADGDGMYSGSVMVTAADPAADGEVTITITASDAAGNAAAPATVMVTLDNTVPEVTEVSVLPSPARNGHEVTISAAVSEAATVTADVSMLDTMQTEMVTLTDADGDGTYIGSFTISEENEADNGSREVTVMATDAAGNSGTAAGSVDLINTLDYTSILPAGISLFHVPLDVTAIDGSEASLSMVSDLYKALGGAVNYLITYDGTTWNSYLGGDSGDAPITADSGIVAVMRTEKTITFTGNAWGEDVGPGAGEGASMITLSAGLNLVGVPVNDASISTVSSIMNLPEFAGKITSIIASTDDGKFVQVAAGGDGDGDVRGDAAYLVSASAAASQPVTGEGWSNGEAVGAAPIALFGHTVDNQTAALFVEGSIVDELTGLAREGFRIKVKNLSTKAALNTISQGDVAQGGYNMTFVDTKAGNAARIGDVLEISADSPNPLIGVKPVRHIVTIDDVKNSRIQLEDLITYEIPAETELLRNYPNPFNPETWIPYRLAEDTDVSLTIYDVNGEMVRSIDVGHQTAAVYESRAKAIYWDGRNRFGEQVASGIYFYSLSAGDFSATRKMVILK